MPFIQCFCAAWRSGTTLNLCPLLFEIVLPAKRPFQTEMYYFNFNLLYFLTCLVHQKWTAVGLFAQARLIYQLADIGRYGAITVISVSAYGSPILMILKLFLSSLQLVIT